MALLFYTCAGLGLALIITGTVALVYVRRVLRAEHTPPSYRRWFDIAFVTSGLLLCSVPFQFFPLGGGKMLGFPFFAAWFDARGADFIGVLTLPALVCNAVVWFLFPHLVLASVFYWRKRSSFANHTHST